MSFLNPVSEPVLRFKSTDAGAPQINYNTRVAGDVKAVLKACLVTGYGTTASAGWTAANEVGNVIEFVSPSAAMSDYRLGIDDSLSSKTTWYYQYQDARVNPAKNAPTKSFSNIDKVNIANGWQLFVTERGIVFVEIVRHTAISKLSSRITYWGAVKSGLQAGNNKNICFFNLGHDSETLQPYYFYRTSTADAHITLGAYTDIVVSTASSSALSNQNYLRDISAVDLVSPIYLAVFTGDTLVGELPAILSKAVNKTEDVYGISDVLLDGRNAVSVCAGYSATNTSWVLDRARTFLIRTDYWEY